MGAGLIHADARTVRGERLADYTEEPHHDDAGEVRWRPAPDVSGDASVLRGVSDPFQPTGGLRVLEGPLGRAVIKTSSVAPERHVIEAPARVFHSQEELHAAFRAGELEPRFRRGRALPGAEGDRHARVRVFADGRALVETAGHEIGNGLYTVAAQTASEGLGIPVEKVSVSLGDTDLPPAAVAGGSISTASVCTVIAQACDAIRMRLGQDGKPAADVTAAMKDRGMGALEEYAESGPHGVAKDGVQALYRGAAMPMGGARLKDRIQFAFGAQFVEARVHARNSRNPGAEDGRGFRVRPNSEPAHRA